MSKLVLSLALVLATGAISLAVSADEIDHSQHQHGSHMAPADAAEHSPGTMNDTRQFVKYPDPLRVHTFANMRDHLLTMGEIQEALARGSFDKASELAEQRLGMSS